MNNDDIGYLESAQWLDTSNRRWNHQELLAAVRAAELRNTGWPVGVVLHVPGKAPTPTPTGIEARIGQFEDGDYDFWSLSEDGRFYFLRKFEEESATPQWTSSRPHPKRSIWWDIRIWRITEALLHSAVLYRELGIPADSPYLLSINHGGLTDRAFYYSSPKYHSSGMEFCKVPISSWQQRVTQDIVIGGLRDLTFDIARQLFVLFNFTEVRRTTVDQIVGQFLQSRV